MTAEAQIADALVRHQVGLQRLATGHVRQILAVLRRAEADVMQRLSAMGDTLTAQRLERYLETLRAIIDSAHRNADGQMVIDLKALAAYETDLTSDIMDRALQAETVRPQQAQVWASVYARPFQGKLLKDLWPELGEAQWRRVRDAIRAGFLEGQSVDQIVRRLRGTRAQGYKDGIFEIGRRQAEAVVRTAVNHTANASRQVSYEANSRYIKGVQWVAVLDHRTTAVCRGRDGMVYPINSGPRPPAHIGCRSTTIPALKRNIPDNSGDDGRVPMPENYDAWLRKQPRGFQDDVLGKAKAKLFRDGGLTLDRFITRAGDELTLDELREREAGAWEKAGL